MQFLNRRRFLQAAGGVVMFGARAARAGRPLRLGLTPVFLDNDVAVLDAMALALSSAAGMPIEFEQRRTYEEVTGLLLQGSIDAAWLCGYPYLQHQDELSVIAVPIWRGQPLYQSYLIVGADDPARSLVDLRGGVHAFSDPDSNSGYLVTATDIIRIGERVESFFHRSIFTYGHRNVVRAVAGGLTRSGSVDGYVWEALLIQEPDLASRTKIISKSEWLGFPPFCSRSDRIGKRRIKAISTALSGLGESEAGKRALALLQLDGMTEAGPELYAGIAERMKDLA